ncbi:hypothetical protein HPB50_015398 [Hyalomma asiaticum]|uniref:Uncharacterized protein n=1 Tax=Hyalomma asiaticum TaxID=266040 RepID=A0ACB7TI14_HYAAI|nr:hypothetical protein HPB50_015398 [Hyalomma asiaticum]
MDAAGARSAYTGREEGTALRFSQESVVLFFRGFSFCATISLVRLDGAVFLSPDCGGPFENGGDLPQRTVLRRRKLACKQARSAHNAARSIRDKRFERSHWPTRLRSKKGAGGVAEARRSNGNEADNGRHSARRHNNGTPSFRRDRSVLGRGLQCFTFPGAVLGSDRSFTGPRSVN